MKDWTKVNENDTEGQKLITFSINQRLKSVLSIGVKNKFKGKRAKDSDEYLIQGLEKWDEAGIQIKKTEHFEMKKLMSRPVADCKVKLVLGEIPLVECI